MPENSDRAEIHADMAHLGRVIERTLIPQIVEAIYRPMLFTRPSGPPAPPTYGPRRPTPQQQNDWLQARLTGRLDPVEQAMLERALDESAAYWEGDDEWD